MRPMLLTVPVVFSVLAALYAAPSTTLQAPQAGPIVSGITPERAAVMRESMQGAWSLYSMRSPGLQEGGRQMQGFLLVAGDYLALEFHLAWTSKQEGLTDEVFQSGIHRFTVDGLRITLRSLIGASNADDEEGLLSYDPMHTERIYFVAVEADLLTLSRGDGTRWVFSRLRGSPRPGTDFFGRPLPKDGHEKGER
jgi:hypothetical protein